MKQQLYAWHKQYRNQFPFRRWVFEQDYHITLKYLGTCDNEQVNFVKQKLASLVALHQPFRLQLSDLGTFGREEKPRILWAGVQGDLPILHHLQANMEEAMENLGFSRENRPYRPHVTLAKHYSGSMFDRSTAATLWRKLVLDSWEVGSIVLYRTELGRQPMYVVEGEYSFQADR